MLCKRPVLPSSKMLLQAKDLQLKLGERTLFEGLSFAVPANSIFVIEGPSGVGKSSLIRLCTKELLPDQGTLNRHELWGEIPQHLALNEELSAEENVQVGQLKGLSLMESFLAAKQPRARAMLSAFGVPITGGRPLKKMSGGERQRVAIVRALLEPWKILFADEPVSQLDEANAEKALEALCAEARNRDGALVLVLHHANLAKKFGTHFLRLDEP
jgi:ABC-type cobalamin/Fe3+-siderophores transport system ATPase subunit